MKKPSQCGKYIVVKRKNKVYKVFLKDLKSIKIRARKSRPPVPSFHHKPSSEFLDKQIDTDQSWVQSSGPSFECQEEGDAQAVTL